MKPDGIAKNGSNFWNLYRVPAKVMIHQQQENAKIYPDGHMKYRKEGEQDVIVMGGIKCFEKDNKLTIMYVISNARLKKYTYKWMATVCFKKKGVTLLINRKNWHEAGKAFVNATYKTMEWDQIVSKAIQGQPTKEFAKTLPNMHQRRMSFQRKLNELILWKAKKVGLNVGKLNKTCARKTDFTLFRLAIGSELMSNTIYYFLKNNRKVEQIKFDAGSINHKHYRFFLKLLRKQKSMEKIVKKVFGRNTKYIMKAVQAKLLHTFTESRTVYKEAISGENGNYVMHEGMQLAVMGNQQTIMYRTPMAVFDISIFVFGHYIKDFINLDRIQGVFADIVKTMQNYDMHMVELVNEKQRVGGASMGTLDLFPDWQSMLRQRPQVEKLFKYLGEARVERIIKEIWNEVSLDGDNYTRGSRPLAQRLQYLRDTAMQWSEKSDKIVIPNNIKSLVEMHDFVSLEYRKLSGDDFPLQFNEEVMAIDGAELEDGLKLKLPRTNFELVHWGQKMHNCIGGYGRSMNRSEGKQWLLGVYKDGDLKYNIEVQGKSVRQFYSHHNGSADPKDKAIVMKFLAEKELARQDEAQSAIDNLQRALENGLYNQPGDLLPMLGLDRQMEDPIHALDAMRYAIQPIQAPERNIIVQNVAIDGNQLNVDLIVREQQAVQFAPVDIEIGDDEAI